MAKTSIIKETRDILQQAGKEAKEHWKEPPEAQIPVGDSGWYTSPNLQSNKGVDPRNCEEWPDSPYCGGNPFTKTPVGFDFDYGVDKCGVWVEATPILGFTKLPPISVGYRQPGECREEKKPPPPPPPPPEAEDTGRPVELLDFPKDIDPNVEVLIVIVRSYMFSYNYGTDPNTGYSSLTIYTDKSVVESHDYPSTKIRPGYYFNSSSGVSKAEAVVKSFYSALQKTRQSKNDEEVSTTDSGELVARNWISVDQPAISLDRRFWGIRQLQGSARYSLISEPNTVSFSLTPMRVGLNLPDYYAPGNFMILGTYGEIAAQWQGYGWDYANYSENSLSIRKAEYKIGYISVPDKRKFPPPPDQKRKKDCCMQCCNGGSQQANKQNQDNAEILRLLRKIDKNIGGFPFKAEIFDADDNKVGIQKRNINVGSLAHANALAIGELQRTLKAIGIDHFPIYSPSSIIEDESHGFLGDLGDLKNKIFKQKIDSLAEFLVWRAKNDNEIFGQWQEVITVQDSDPNIKGNQPKRVVLPNMAKSFKEIILLLSVLIKSQGFSMDALLKMYIDVANTKVSAAVSEAILRDVQDYLDYPTNTKPLDVPMGITIPKDNDPTDDKEDIERFLKNSIMKAMFDDWTGEGSLHDMMLTLLDAASKQIQKPHT